MISQLQLWLKKRDKLLPLKVIDSYFKGIGIEIMPIPLNIKT